MQNTLPQSYKLLEKEIGYSFNNPEIIDRALTHSSYSNEMGVKNHHLLCNERLEFLGDSVLSLITSEYIFAKFADSPEGDLTRLRADLVCEKALSKYAGKISLGNYLKLGNGEEKNNGRRRPSILADAFEALLAAIYLDSGDKERVKSFLLPFITAQVAEMESAGFNLDFKTMLQQFVQQSEGDLLEYVTVGEKGPDHMKTFEVEARLNSNVVGRGSGRTKREAEQNAAKAALELFGVAENK